MMRFRTLFLFFALAELASYAGYFFPAINTAGFFVIVAAALVLSLRRLEYGLYFVLADLILGGKSGALFSFQYDGFFLSLRMALFIIVMGVWAGKMILQMIKHLTPSNSPSERGRNDSISPPARGGVRGGGGGGVMQWWSVLGLAIAWGIIFGVARGNNFGDLFLDANGYFYAAMILPFWWVCMRMDAKGRCEWMRMLKMVFFAATTLLALKTLFAVYWFTHAGNNLIGANLVPFYRWVRDTGVGEITWLPGNFARVFFQSHVYNVVAFFVLLASVVHRRSAGLHVPLWRWLSGTRGAALLVLNTSVIIVSLSRSFWVGTIAGLGVLVISLWSSVRKDAFDRRVLSPATPYCESARALARYSVTLIAAVLGALLLLLVVARFPFPRPSPADLGDAVQSRLEAGDAGQSRWNLLPPLTREALEHPILGSGFGTRVTYISNDPRIREVNSTGEYSTTAFEWGWVDLWLKMGILGLIAYAGLLIALGRAIYRTVAFPLSCTLIAGLAALAAIHVFTPYLNHPLGFGILVLFTVIPAGIAKQEPL
ncbi:MAG: O-antigen ligase family protein [bacterium]|nr:O-antigen ligase family protein [bacterium]